MKKISKKFQFPKVFSYYVNLLRLMKEGKPLPYGNIYCCGGKNSGKTYCVCLFISYLFYYNISAIVLVSRKAAQDIGLTVQEVLDRLNAAGFPYKHNKSKNIIVSNDGKTKVVFYSLFNPQKKKIQKLGLTGNSNYTYEITWFEEVWEMDEVSVQDVKLAVRGAKYKWYFFLTNPYHVAHWFVSFYVKKLLPNRKLLVDNGFMMKALPNTGELVHYTNYRVNPGAKKEDIEAIETLKHKDPIKYDVVGISLPGTSQGGAYAHLLKHVSRLTRPGNVFSAGLDWGLKKDPLTVILLTTSDNYDTVNVVEELQIKTESRWTNKDLAYMVCKWLRALSELYPDLKEGLIVLCDKSAIIFIEMLNDMVRTLNLGWISFIPAPQVEVEQRIWFKQGLMSGGKLNIPLECPILYNELLLATIDPESAKIRLLPECSDHMMDAFDYALTPWYGNIQLKINPYYFPKGKKHFINKELLWSLSAKTLNYEKGYN